MFLSSLLVDPAVANILVVKLVLCARVPAIAALSKEIEAILSPGLFRNCTVFWDGSIPSSMSFVIPHAVHPCTE